MNYRILTDADVKQELAMSVAIQWIEEAFRQHANGQLICPGRLVSDVVLGQLVFTVGASKSASPHIGFRVYDLEQLHSPNRSELTAVFDATNGALRGLVVGPYLGALRTGAIGGVAIKYLAPKDAKCLGLVGTGFQAATQLEAALAVHDFDSIIVFSRNLDRRRSFAKQMQQQLQREISVADSVRSVCESADILICSTTSATPVIESDWLKPNVHINNLGPKFNDASEIGLDVFSKAQRLVTDSLAQIEAYGERFVLHDHPAAAAVVDLSSIVCAAKEGSAEGDATERLSPGISIFVSLGLAGTEVVLANGMFTQMQRQ